MLYFLFSASHTQRWRSDHICSNTSTPSKKKHLLDQSKSAHCAEARPQNYAREAISSGRKHMLSVMKQQYI